MKKSINAWSVESSANFEDMFSQIKNAGFDGIELNIDGKGRSAHSLTLDMTDDELMDILAISHEYDLPVVSVSTSLWWSANMGSANQENRDFARRLLEKQLICAKTFGSSGILTVPGGISDEISISEAYENSLDFLDSCKDIIEDYQVNVGLENVWNAFFLSPFDMANFIDSVKSKYITAYYDVGNAVAFSWSEYWIEILDKRIIVVPWFI